ncbi:MAG: hypothetical protein LUG99_00290 [Lachnospiraceae bacterium]|nr:hypothetical protein [Lachnospiraceae bacterium]
MQKWAIYKSKVGLYAKEYIDTLEGCKNILGGCYVKEEDLPIVVNNAGGRCCFYPVEDNFVEIIEKEDGEEPLTREQRYPKNSKDFEYGWISPDGDTFNTDYEGHYRAAEMICKEYGYSSFSPERSLEEKGWVKITRYHGERQIFAEDLFITKAQADTMIDLGYSLNPQFIELVTYSEERW